MQPTAQLDKSLLTLIGNTPLVRLNKMPARLGISDAVEIYGKAEWMNPGGSVKDRPALNIIETAEADGTLTKNKILLDATSGNTGIEIDPLAYAKADREATKQGLGVWVFITRIRTRRPCRRSSTERIFLLPIGGIRLWKSATAKPLTSAAGNSPKTVAPLPKSR